MKQKFRVGNGNHNVEFSMDLTEGNACDDAIVFYLQRGWVCEPEVTHAMMQIIKVGDTVIDGGANIGFFTLLMSQLVGPTGKVIAVEPGAENLEKLKANLALNDSTNVEIVEKALWREPATLPMFFYEDGGGNSAFAHAQGDTTTEIEATTIDAICWTKHAPKLIKLDIEGAEHCALIGAKQTLKDHAPFVLSEINTEALAKAGSSPQDMRAEMFMRGYQVFSLPSVGGLPAMVPENSKLMPCRLNANVMFSSIKRVGEVWKDIII